MRQAQHKTLRGLLASAGILATVDPPGAVGARVRRVGPLDWVTHPQGSTEPPEAPEALVTVPFGSVHRAARLLSGWGYRVIVRPAHVGGYRAEAVELR